MPKLSLLAGTTSKSVKIFVQDSSVTTGAGLTGLVFNTASLTAYYIIEGQSSMTAITLVTATLGTWTSGGFIVVDAAHAPGLYELGLPNAALAAGKSVVVYLFGAANMAPVILEIELTAVDNQDATKYGMTGLLSPTTSGRTLDVTATGEAGIDWNNIGAPTTTVNLSGTSTKAVEPTVAGRTLDVSAGGEAGLDWANIGSKTTTNALTGTTVGLVLTEALGASPWDTTTVADALKAAWSQAVGKWVLSGTTLTLYAPDGTTALKAFTLDSSTSPTSRS